MSRMFLCFVCLGFVLVACEPGEKSDTKGQGETTAKAKEVNDYPDIKLTMQEGSELSTRNLEGNNIFIFFQPDCRHCQLEAVQIEQRLEDFKDYTLYFISSGEMEAITAFAESFDLDESENVKFARASTESVLKHYGPIQTPSVYIYSKGVLKKSFNGQTEIDNILNAL